MQPTNTLIPKAKKGEKRRKISQSELSIILQKLDGSQATVCTMVTMTEPKIKKTGNPYRDEKIQKVSAYAILLNFNYTNSVNNQLEREGKDRDFQAQENWHTKKYDSFNGCVAMKMDGNQKQEYLFYKTNHVKRLGFVMNGKPCTTEETETIKLFLPEYSAPKNQGTEEAVIVQTIKLQNIKIIKLKGQIYEIVNNL